jgi:hypothetical protein
MDGAGDGTRTRDVQLGKLAFFQLNYSRSVDSLSVAETATCAQHQNPPAWESQILPLENTAFVFKHILELMSCSTPSLDSNKARGSAIAPSEQSHVTANTVPKIIRIMSPRQSKES